MSSLDYLDLCRLCLVKDRVSVPIFEDEGDVRQIFLKIATCLPVKVGREDKLPKKICDDCGYKVELFYEFWNTTTSAEKQLLQWLGDAGDMDGKEEYIRDSNIAKLGQSAEDNRLEGTGMRRVNDRSSTDGARHRSQRQIDNADTDMDASATAGPSAVGARRKNDDPTSRDEEEDEDEEEDNSDEECDGDEGVPIKEESEEEPGTGDTIEPTTFINVSLDCDEAGPSGLQRQKIGEISEMAVGMQTMEGNSKSGRGAPDPLEPDFPKIQLADNYLPIPVGNARGLPMLSACPMNGNKATFNPIQPNQLYSFGANGGGIAILKDASSLMPLRPIALPMVKVMWPGKVPIAPLPNNWTRTPAPKKKKSKVAKKKPRGGKRGRKKRAIKSEPTIKRDRADGDGEEEEAAENSADGAGDGAASGDSKANVDVKDGGLVPIKTDRTGSGEEPPRFECKDCSKKLRNLTELKRHEKTHAKSYICNDCGYETRAASALERHMVKHVDKSTLPFKCTECDKGFDEEIDLLEHYDYHSVAKPFDCQKCGTAFATKRRLSNHVRNNHPELRPNRLPSTACDICGRVLATKRSLARHKESHNPTKLYLCDFCGKSLSSAEHLKKHRRIHTGEKPYVCDVCGKGFTGSTYLRMHTRIHTGEKPYKCDQCPKAFSQRTTLTIHRRGHTGEKPYICQFCQRGFSCQGNLTAHQKSTCV